MIDPKIFRQYDIRGVWGAELTGEAVRAIGQAFALRLRQKLDKDDINISIGRDVRLSSPDMVEALTRGLLSAGINVVDIGTCPTPLQYFSIYHLGLDGGAMITGSHNPPEYNGLKLSIGKSTLYGEAIQEIKTAIEAGLEAKGAGKLTKHDIIPDYVSDISARFGSLEGLKVVVDAGNGTGGLVAPQIMRQLGADVVELYCEPDGTFPAHHPDPVVPENLKDLIEKVRTEGAHFGVSYDGDADRIGVVDGDGDIIWGDKLMVIFARDILKETPGATVIGEVKCSQTLYDDIKARGGNPIMWKTGHSLIKGKMKETKALLAGEMSGHIFFADRFFGFDDAIYASLRLMEILKKNGQPYSLKKLLEGLPEMVSTPEIRFECPDDVKFDIVERAKAAFADYPVIDIDGVRVNFPDGWGLIRASNTQPALVMRFEGKDEAALKRIRDTVEGELNKLL